MVKDSKKYSQEAYEKPFPTALRGLMDETGTSQQSLADYLGLKNRQSVGSYCAGYTSPDFDSLTKIAKFFHVSTDYLLGLSESRSVDNVKRAACEYTGLSDGAMDTLHNGIGFNSSVAIDSLLRTGAFQFSINALASALVMAEQCSRTDDTEARAIEGARLTSQIAKEHPEYNGKFAVYIGRDYVKKLIDDAVNDYRRAADKIVLSRMGD